MYLNFRQEKYSIYPKEKNRNEELIFYAFRTLKCIHNNKWREYSGVIRLI
jgi:hypothetical protein